jgi:ABC-type metal ion transport system substrate-binding protein
MLVRPLIALLACAALAACVKPQGGELDTLIVAADPDRHAPMLQAIDPQMAEQGVHMKIAPVADPAQAVLSGHADAALGPTKVEVDRINGGGDVKLAKIAPVDRPSAESDNGPHTAYLVVRLAHKNDLRVQKLASALTTPTVRSFIQDRFSGAVQPAF